MKKAKLTTPGDWVLHVVFLVCYFWARLWDFWADVAKWVVTSGCHEVPPKELLRQSLFRRALEFVNRFFACMFVVAGVCITCALTLACLSWPLGLVGMNWLSPVQLDWWRAFLLFFVILPFPICLTIRSGRRALGRS